MILQKKLMVSALVPVSRAAGAPLARREDIARSSRSRSWCRGARGRRRRALAVGRDHALARAPSHGRAAAG